MIRKHNTKLTDLITFVFSMEMMFLFFNGLQFFNFGRYYIFAIIIVVLGFIYFFREKSLNGGYLFILFPIIFSMFSIIALSKPYTLDYFFAVILFCTHSYVLLQIKFEQYQRRIIENAFIMSAVLMSVILLIQRGEPYIDIHEVRFALYYSKDGFYDVNFTAAYFYFPACICVLRGLERKEIRYYLAYIIIVCAIFATGSRGTILPIMAITVFLLLKAKSPIIFVIIPLGIIGLLFFLPEEIFERLFVTSYIGNNTRRLSFWGYGLKLIFNNLLWGDGIRASKQAVIEMFNVERVTVHNTYIVWLSSMGVIGGLPFLIYMFLPAIKCILKQKLSILLIISGFLFCMLMIEGNFSFVCLIPLNCIYMLCDDWCSVSLPRRRKTVTYQLKKAEGRN